MYVYNANATSEIVCEQLYANTDLVKINPLSAPNKLFGFKVITGYKAMSQFLEANKALIMEETKPELTHKNKIIGNNFNLGLSRVFLKNEEVLVHIQNEKIERNHLTENEFNAMSELLPLDVTIDSSRDNAEEQDMYNLRLYDNQFSKFTSWELIKNNPVFSNAYNTATLKELNNVSSISRNEHLTQIEMAMTPLMNKIISALVYEPGATTYIKGINGKIIGLTLTEGGNSSIFTNPESIKLYIDILTLNGVITLDLDNIWSDARVLMMK